MHTYKALKQFNKFLFVVAHPDDFESYYGGLAALLSNDGKEIHITICTDGKHGKPDANNGKTIDTRHKETKCALRKLNIPGKNLHQLHHEDGMLKFNTLSLTKDIVETIRRVKPDVICTHDPHLIDIQAVKLGGYFVNHPDHRAVAESVLDAAYPYAQTETFLNKAKLPAHDVRHVLLASDARPDPNMKIDISEVVELKRRAMLCHKSQFTKELVDRIICEDNKRGDKYFEFFRYLRLLV